jgi:UDP-N-acetylglucosamine diphosphorylase/glucosamine-1-phosphate N-acetyltransferase
MRICLYEDRRVAALGPLTLTRPAAELLCGLSPLGEKQARYFAAESVGHLCRPVMADLVRASDPAAPVNDPAWLRSAPAVLVNARWVPPARPLRGPRPRLAGSPAPTFRELFADGPFLGTCDGDIAFAVLDTRRLQPVSPATLDDCLDDWSHTLPAREVGGHLIRHPWDLVDLNPDQLVRDFEAAGDPTGAGYHPTGFALVGPADRLLIHPSARIDPMVVADTTGGPVVIGPGAVVAAFTRLEGPCAIGPHTRLLGANVRAGTTLGPHCRVGGEVECSVVQGYSNKAHDGFLGHSYVGEWVNLAAGTTTGDLRNDYRPVTVPLDGEEVPTGRTKVGSFIGDHAKTGLGVLLNCGSVIGAFACLLPTGQYAPREVPPFTRFGPGGLTDNADLGKLLATADVVMRRRGKELTPVLETVYRSAAARAAGERRTATTGVASDTGRRRTA